MLHDFQVMLMLLHTCKTMLNRAVGHLGGGAERGALALAGSRAGHARRQRLGQVAHRRQHGLLQGVSKDFHEPRASRVQCNSKTMPMRMPSDTQLRGLGMAGIAPVGLCNVPRPADCKSSPPGLRHASEGRWHTSCAVRSRRRAASACTCQRHTRLPVSRQAFVDPCRITCRSDKADAALNQHAV